MANFATTIPITDALWPATEKALKKESMLWTPRNAFQQFVVDLKEPSLELADTLDHNTQLMSQASNICKVVNQFLVNQGFPSIQLQDRGSLNMLYVASVMKLMGNWPVHGVRNYRLKKIGKPGFRIPKSAGVRHYVYRGQRVAVVPTKSNFHFVVTKPTGETGFGMLTDWQTILHEMDEVDGNGLILSQADIGETKIEVSDLEGMYTTELFPWVIQEALMAAKFGLTPSHVKFESAFAYSSRCLGISEGLQPEAGDYVADHDLYFAIVRRPYWLPLATGLVPANELSSKDLE